MIGLPLDTVIISLRKLLIRYAPDSEKLFPIPATVTSTTTIPATPAAVVLTAQELEEDAALAKQIQANENLIQTTSCVIRGYGDGNKFNTALTNLAKVQHPEVSIKVLYVTVDELTQYLVSLYPNASYNELHVFVVSVGDYYPSS